jgi:hypothetical protein
MSDSQAGGLDALQENLFRIPEQEFKALVYELEERRLDEARARKIALIMRFLRPRLAILKPHRRMTLLRLMCMPYEDILYNPGSPRKAIGKIPRNAIKSVWGLLLENVDRDRVRQFEEQLASMKIEEQTRESLFEIGLEFWPFCASALRGVIVVAEGSTRLRRELIEKMGDDNHFASLKEVVSMLEVAQAIMILRENLSKGPIDTVSNRDLDAIIAAFTAVNAKGPDYQECVIYVILARLADMATITDVFQRIDNAGAGAVITQVSDTAAQAMVSQMEDQINDQIKDMEDDISVAPDRETLARQAGSYVNSLAGAAKAIGQTGSRQQSRRVGQVRGELATKVLENVLIEGDEATAALLATLLSSVSSFDEDEDSMSADVLEKIQDRIVSLRVAERYAEDIGLGGEVEQRLNTIEKGLTDRADRLLSTFSIGSDRNRAEVNLNGTVRLLELVMGPEAADEFRVRGRQLLDGD